MHNFAVTHYRQSIGFFVDVKPHVNFFPESSIFAFITGSPLGFGLEAFLKLQRRLLVNTCKAEEQLPKTTQLRQVKYLNNQVEQDHRFIKRLTKPGLGFGSFNTARRTLRGFEAMNMIRKGQVQGVRKGDVRASIEFVSQLFEIAQQATGNEMNSLSSIHFCDTTFFATQPHNL